MALNIVPVNTSRWQPGKSGNPKGAPRRNERTLQDLARAHTEEAVKTLVVALHNPKERVTAAIALLDRGWGRPKQVIEAEGGVSSIHLHLIAALETKSQSEQPPTIQHNEPQPANLLDAPVPTE